MKYVHIDSVEAGQHLGKAVFSSNGNVLLAENVQLTVFMINQLRRIGVTMIYIKDELFDDIEIEEVVSEKTRQAVMKCLGDTYQMVKSGKEFNTKHVSVNVDTLLEEVMRNKDVLIQLTDIRTEDNALYMHALNVCIMSIMIGINMNLNQLQLKELAMGALLHDIGKVGLKPEDEAGDIRRHHTWRGFEILKNKREYSLLIAHVAFQHHEAVDGSGLPRGITEEGIHLYAKIVAAANAYDNMLSSINGKKPMLPHQACEQMLVLAGNKLDRDIVIHFLKTVSVYPTGSSVKLSTKETGIVVGQHRGLPSRPVVRIVKAYEEAGQMEVKEVDLAKQTTVFIDSVTS